MTEYRCQNGDPIEAGRCYTYTVDGKTYLHAVDRIKNGQLWDHKGFCNAGDLEAEAPKDNDGYYLWDGGECPVPDIWQVYVKFRNGATASQAWQANNLSWSQTGEDDDIVAFKIVSTGECRPDTPEVATQEYSGGSVSYYRVRIESPTTIAAPYEAECNDIIEALGMNYAEGNAFKAIWRRCAARQGKAKAGYKDGLYDAEKVVFFGQRMVVATKEEGEATHD